MLCAVSSSARPNATIVDGGAPTVARRNETAGHDRVSMKLGDRITVVIPAAGRVPSEPPQADGAACPAMIPVGGRPVVYWTLRYLYELGIRKFVIAVAERGLYIE